MCAEISIILLLTSSPDVLKWTAVSSVVSLLVLLGSVGTKLKQGVVLVHTPMGWVTGRMLGWVTGDILVVGAASMMPGWVHSILKSIKKSNIQSRKKLHVLLLQLMSHWSRFILRIWVHALVLVHTTQVWNGDTVLIIWLGEHPYDWLYKLNSPPAKHSILLRIMLVDANFNFCLCLGGSKS